MRKINKAQQIFELSDYNSKLTKNIAENPSTCESSYPEEEWELDQYPFKRSMLYKSNENSKYSKNIALNQEIACNNNNVNCEISLTSRVPDVSPVVLAKSSKSRDSSPMKTITFDVFDNEKPSPKPFDDKVKYIEMRKCKSSKKVAHKTLKKYTKVISFNLSNKESEEVENMPNPPQTEPDDEENKREEFKCKFSRHCRSTAPNEFLKELKNLNLNEEIVESGNTLRRRIPNK